MKTFSRTNVLTAVVSSGIAAMTALVVTGAPSAGAVRLTPSVTATPVIISGSKASVIITTTATVTLPLPAGRWAIFAKADASTQGGGPVQFHCTLKAGTSKDHTDPELESGGSAAFDENIALNVAHKFTGAGSAVLSCNSSGVTVDLVSVKITAIKAGTLNNVKLR